MLQRAFDIGYWDRCTIILVLAFGGVDICGICLALCGKGARKL
jgi:hypothetical protein